MDRRPLQRFFLRIKWLLSSKRDKSYYKFLLEGGDEKLRYHFPMLSSGDVVFDVGGYRGDWADVILEKYNPYIYIFEPVPSYAERLKNKFHGNSKVKVNSFGLSDRNKMVEIGVAENASSVFNNSEDRIRIELRDVSQYIEEMGFAHISVMKINIEGGEFSLLSRLIESGFIRNIEIIQVQFHDFVDNAEVLYERIRMNLSKTHWPRYCYSFVWEEWVRK